MAANTALSSIKSLSDLTTRWATLKDLIASIKDVFLIGQGDPELYKTLQEYTEEFDQLDMLLGEIFLVGMPNPYRKGLVSLLAA